MEENRQDTPQQPAQTNPFAEQLASFDNEVDRDRRISELFLYEDKEIVCQNVDDNNMYILKYTVKQL